MSLLLPMLLPMLLPATQRAAAAAVAACRFTLPLPPHRRTTIMEVTSNLLYVPARTSPPLSLSSQLKTHVATAWSEKPEKYAADFEELDTLRDRCLRPELHDTYVKHLVRYYGQLGHVASRFPIDEDHIKICFTWQDGLGRRGTHSSFAVGYERASVLYNIGAAYSRLGAHQDRSDGNGLKRAALYFRFAAGAFIELLDLVTASPETLGLGDLRVPVVESLAAMCMAQGQECFWHKAVVGGLSSGTIARLAVQTALYYEAAARHATNNDGFPPWWTTHLTTKSWHFRAASQVRKAQECASTNEYGVQVARLRAAQSFADRATAPAVFKQLSPFVQSDITALSTVIGERLASAVKDNDTIYYQRVPESVPDIEATSMMEAIRPSDSPTFAEDVGPRLFGSAVPTAVHDAVARYKQRRDGIIQSQAAGVAQSTQTAQALLNKLRLPQSLEAHVSPPGVPPALLQKAEEIRRQGGARALQAMAQAVAEASQADQNRIAESIRILDAELQEDEQLRAQVGAEWNRPPSSQLAQTLRHTIESWRDKMAAAHKSDQVIAKKMQQHLPTIEQLEGPAEVLMQSLPATHGAAGENDPHAAALQRALGAFRQFQQQREAQLEQLRQLAASDDIETVLLAATASAAPPSDAAALDTIIERQLARYTPLQQTLQSSAARQDALLADIEARNARFVESSREQPPATSHEKRLKQLEDAAKYYREIHRNLSEGTRFYTEFGKVLQQHTENCRQFAMARGLERKEFMAVRGSSSGPAYAYPAQSSPGGSAVTSSTQGYTQVYTSPQSQAGQPQYYHGGQQTYPQQQQPWASHPASAGQPHTYF
ncbi:hypothetical protein CXG81DRAFT_17030 [Caulochytrium protostelioides]|uniref:BRO domain-containing protein 1 n=1 Tax=Caulochytrium protostelioides TaxID=1555241 RepID=A0A4P9XD40_9FUNG|nr:hypothetical protein CXG81DRAFT_17030 [Caulochytrium protostelioides]|eukprot:RKP03406.1 hypothetical protein CXG81DRAFT_17030 [Caulochytrium protostelioides]